MIQKFLDVSTIHMPSSNAYEELDCVIADYDEGFFAFVPMADEIVDAPEWFREMCELAIQNDCQRIRVDSCGEEYDELKKYNWQLTRYIGML